MRQQVWLAHDRHVLEGAEMLEPWHASGAASSAALGKSICWAISGPEAGSTFQGRVYLRVPRWGPTNTTQHTSHSHLRKQWRNWMFNYIILSTRLDYNWIGLDWEWRTARRKCNWNNFWVLSLWTKNGLVCMDVMWMMIRWCVLLNELIQFQLHYYIITYCHCRHTVH